MYYFTAIEILHQPGEPVTVYSNTKNFVDFSSVSRFYVNIFKLQDTQNIRKPGSIESWGHPWSRSSSSLAPLRGWNPSLGHCHLVEIGWEWWQGSVCNVFCGSPNDFVKWAKLHGELNVFKQVDMIPNKTIEVLPKFTGLYHRYMRHLVAAIVVLVSCLSMLLGFYDLHLDFKCFGWGVHAASPEWPEA